MEQDREKLKVIDIEFKDYAAHDETLFVDVTGYKFLDDFLIIESYKEYSDETVRGLLTYIPKDNTTILAMLYVKYKDDEEAKNGRGIAVNLYQDVKHYGFLAEGINLLKIELEDDNREAIYIPMSNIALIEYFKSMEKFNRAYPPGTGCGY